MLRRNPQGYPHQLKQRTIWAVAVLSAAACLAVAGVGPLRSAAIDPPPPGAAAEVTAPAAVDRHGDPLPAGALARLGTTRWRHGANVTFVAFGTDGKTLFTAGQDNTVRMWDMATGQEIRRFGRSKPAETGTPPIAPPAARIQLEARTLELNVAAERLKALQAQLDATIRQQAKPAEGKTPPAGQPKAIPAEKGQPDVKAAQLQAELAAKKAQLEVQAAQLATMRGDVNAFVAAVAPDGKTLAIASSNVIQVYEVETGKDVRKINGSTAGLAGVVGLLFSPDSRTLATRAADGAVIVWEAVSGNEIRRINAPSPPGNLRLVQANALRGGNGPPGMAFTPDAKTLAVATTEIKEQTLTSSVKMWDVATGKESGRIKEAEGQTISAVAFAPGGKVLACASADIVFLCELDTGKELRVINAPDGVVSLVFSPDGKVLALRTRSDQVRLCETETGKEIARLGVVAPPAAPNGVILASPLSIAPEVRNLAFSPDGKQVATASGGTIRFWDSATGKELPLSDSHQGTLTAIALSKDGKTVVSWAADRTIRRWEAATGKPLGFVQLPVDATMAVLSPDGRSVALAKGGNRIQLLDTATGQEWHGLAGPTSGISALAFTPDGKVLAARGGDNAITLYDLVHGGELRPMAAPVVNNPAPGGVVVVNALGRAGGGARAGLAFSPDGKLLVSTGGASVIPGTRNTRTTTDLYDVATGKLIRKLESPQPAVSFAFSPDSRVLATEHTDQSISLWEVASGKEQAQLNRLAANTPSNPIPGVFAVASDRRIVSAQPAGPVTLAFSPDGRALIARGPDVLVRVWDVVGGKEVSLLKGHEGRVETIAFAPDGQTIATGSADTTILLWDAAAAMKDVSKPELAELPDETLERLWGDLAGEDAGKAYRSILKLAGAPKQAVPFLGERVKPATAVDVQQVERWVADLENARFAVRQQATTNLAKAGEQVVPALQKVLASQPTIETRKRVEDLLDKLTGGILSSEQLRLVRAVEALERMGTPEARQLLQTLAGGAAGALTTRQAQEALGRLSKG